MKKSGWSLHEKSRKLEPLKFSNNKTQEDVVNEVLQAINDGDKIIFIKGVCGTGKSAIALNIAKSFSKSSIVVPIKNLQKQYNEDYAGKKYLLKENGEKLKIQIIAGRNNYECPFLKENKFAGQEDHKLSRFLDFSSEKKSEEIDLSCENPNLPCTIEIKEKNIMKIREYLRKNPKIKYADFKDIKDVRRMSIAPICPYWCPIVPAEVELNLEGTKKRYQGLNEREYSLYSRKQGCGYYNQFNSYIDSDVLIFNSQKYMIETVMDRKPATEIEIIDECDDFLDNFANYDKINLNRLNYSLSSLFSDNEKVSGVIDKVAVLTRLMANSQKIQQSIEKKEILKLKDTNVYDILKHFLDNDLMNSVECDEENYCYHCDEAARTFEDFFDESYVSFYKEEKDIIAKIVTVSLEKKFSSLLEKNKVFVMMSGTVHSDKVLREIFGIKNFKIIEAETKMPGKITKCRTGMEIDCRYENFRTGKVTRENYLMALNKCITSAKKPILVHVNSFSDLPTKDEAEKLNLSIMTQDKLRRLQDSDFGELIRRFKEKEIEILYSTRCNRGVDFPGEMCNSIVLTKYPYPDISSIFWRILRKNNPNNYNEFYVDKAKREFLQRIYRGLRSSDDHVYLFSPDIRVFQNLKE